MMKEDHHNVCDTIIPPLVKYTLAVKATDWSLCRKRLRLLNSFSFLNRSQGGYHVTSLNRSKLTRQNVHLRDNTPYTQNSLYMNYFDPK